MSKRIVGRIPDHRKPKTPNSQARIHIHSTKGVALEAPPMKPGNPTGKGGGRRGSVSKWTSASRRRMREWLLLQRPVDREEVAVTLTIPGAPLPPREAKELFHKFSLRMTKAHICAVWRIELQPRGQLHWHLLAGIEDGSQISTIHKIWSSELERLGWVSDWYDPCKHVNLGKGLDQGPDFEIEDTYQSEPGEIYPGQIHEQADFIDSPGGIRPVVHFRHRMLMPGAHLRACQVKTYDGRNNWLRYMQDHATKHKQEQIPDDIGRHWGVINRKAYTQNLPDSTTGLTDRQYYRILRWLQRLATPRILDDRAPFGRRAGYRIKRGRFGRTVWFSQPATIQRMIDHAVKPDNS